MRTNGSALRTLSIAIGAGLAMWLSVAALAVTDITGHHRIGLLPPVWLLLVCLTVTAGLTHARVSRGRATRLLAWSLVILLPWLPIPIPDAFLLWTGPMVHFTWFTIAVSAGAAWLRLIERPAFRIVSDPRAAPRIACVLAFCVFLAVHYRQPLPPVGDEPHYLLIAQSLLLDHDLEVSNNYERQDYLAYYNGPLRPHYARAGKDGARYSLHGPALPALIAPAFAIGGFRAVVLWLGAIAALGTLFVWKAAHALTSDVAAAWFAWAAGTLTTPFVLQSTLVYPDAVAGTVLSGGVLAMLTAASLSTPAAAAVGIGVAVLPWLHPRFATMGGLLVVALALRVIGLRAERRTAWPALLGLGVPMVISAAVWVLISLRVYGTFDPTAAYDARVPLEPGRIFGGLLGLVADQEFGLLPNAPVHVLWTGAALVLWRRHRRLGVELACIAVPYIVAVAAFPYWFGGGSTPARYLTPLALPLAVPMAALWSRQGPLGRALSVTLLTVSVLIACAFGFGGDGSLAYNAGQGRAAVFDWLAPAVNLPGALPSYFRAIPAEGPARGSLVRELAVPVAVWATASIAIWCVVRWILRRRRIADAIGAPALAVFCVIAVVLVSLTMTWRYANVPRVIATRAQLNLIAREDPRTTPLGVQLVPIRLMPSGDALRRLELSTSPLDAPPSTVPLEIYEVPPGEYRVRPRFRAEPGGDISLSVGRAGLPLASWHLAAADKSYSFRLPITASTLTITADAAATQSLRSVALIPVRHISDPRLAATRARAAARYGDTIVYAIDTRVLIEPDGFWVLGERQPDVIMTPDSPRRGITLEVSNVTVPNQVRISSARWSDTRALVAHERWIVNVPYEPAAESVTVNFSVAHGAIVAGRMLGCHVRIVE